MRKILIFGKNGFIGKNLYEYFEERDFDVTAMTSKGLNLLEEEKVADVLLKGNYDVVINAAIYNPRVGIGKESSRELEYDLRMFHNLAKYNNYYGLMIYFGSGAEYDKRYPICNVSEEELCNHIPQSQYALAKYIIGREIEAGIYGADNIYNLRVFGLFGKYENWKTTFISGACCKTIKNLPITIRQDVYFDYLYIDDFCKLIERFIEINKPNYKTYNITSDKKILLSEIARIINEISGKKVPVYICRDGLANEYTANSSRLLKELRGYNYMPMEESIKQLYRWYETIQDTIDTESLLY